MLLRCDDAYLAVTDSEQLKADSYISLSQCGDGRTPEDLDSSSSVQEKVCSPELDVMKVRLRRAEETAQKVQTEVTRTVGRVLRSLCFVA